MIIGAFALEVATKIVSAKMMELEEDPFLIVSYCLPKGGGNWKL